MSIAVETIMIIASKLDYMQAGEENRQHYAVSFPLLPDKSDGEKDLAELFAALSLFPPIFKPPALPCICENCGVFSEFFDGAVTARFMLTVIPQP